ncbi:ent-copalyl diphosphate synthase 1-like [Macadamia integrifolia]|uniref:ent-copalyl diphosphate synthase 1-like n=1 Tax=Macadamia integrifolia TaxID=60698 RepID=UPI001C4F8952|nr:ent-copalyl diphosphate synthase 1-like [Macadamia integrifolia]
MPSATYLLRFSPATPHRHRWISLSHPDLQKPFSGVWSIAARNEVTNLDLVLRSRCKVISKTIPRAYTDLFQKGQPGLERQETLQGDKEAISEVCIENEIEKRIQFIKSMLGSMEDGEISVSAYDTAWVALVKDINKNGVPQFPSSLQWIVENQLLDGSWGDRFIFSAHDRILNTLACVVALKSWNIYPGLCEKGMAFIRENMSKLEGENEEHMPIGFEVAFPSLMEIAQMQDLQIPTDTPFIQDIYAKRDLKLTKIPKDMMHIVPTTLLHSLEGMAGLDWEKLLKLQCEDGSFLFSPSSTAYGLMETKDERCLTYLKKVIEKFNGGVPNVYPVDLFEHIWVVDRLERLGISRFFQSEIQDCINYIHRYWTEDGICWARNSRVHDIDDTAMGFRLLRLHGHEVSPDAFQNFQKGSEFFCFAGQSNQAITGIFNLYRASQVLFPGEIILEEAKTFASKFLSEKQESNQILDKWIITKDLPGEVRYALDIPWYASLPRVEARFYIEHYGGDNDVWIGKTLYRMPYVNNNDYLELAKLDFNNCQRLHQLEWTSMKKWYRECNIGELGLGRRELLLAYFVAAASIFEPERANERLAWAKTAVLIEAVRSYMGLATTTDVKKAFLNDFNYIASFDINDNNDTIKMREAESMTIGKELVETLLTTLNCIALETLVAHRIDVRQHLRSAWNTWLETWCQHHEVERENDQNATHERGLGDGEAELLVGIINLSAGRSLSEEQCSQPHYRLLIHLVNAICFHLRPLLDSMGNWKKDNNSIEISGPEEVEPLMQELVQLVLLHTPDGIDPEIKKPFLTVAKSFYYVAHCNLATINNHMAKVLFERVA